MVFSALKKNKGFVILFAVTLASILLAIAIGISNIALNEVNFSTSVKDSDNAFYAADTGAECALYYDKSSINKFPITGPASSVSCAGATIPTTFSGTSNTGSYSFTIPNLGDSLSSCAKVTVSKDASSGTLVSTIDPKGYNIGSPFCSSSSTSLVERELQVNVSGTPLTNGSCQAAHYSCASGTSDNEVYTGTSWTWTCDGFNGGSTASCSESVPIVFSATGGTITYTDSNGLNPRSSPSYAGGYTVHTFTSGGTFAVSSGSATVTYLILGGGASGGYACNGGAAGGGAGGLVTGSTSISTGSYPITVGAGGSSVSTGCPGAQGINGGSSTFNSLTALGGGGGGGARPASDSLANGLSGGSGGGAGYEGYTSAVVGPGTAGQGNSGGQNDAVSASGPDGGGGGGAGSPGVVSSTYGTGGAGGSGVASSISGSSTTYGVGGPGSSYYNASFHPNGAANTGTGGGGMYGTSAGPSGAGGSGIVILRYPTPQ